MIKPNQWVEVSWHNLTKDWYESKGYVFTKYKDKFKVKAEDLSYGCHRKIIVICDYCGKEYSVDYCAHIRSVNNHGDCCKKCQPQKFKSICIERYGCENVFQTEWVKEKSKQTCLDKYGHERACQASVVKDKIANTNLLLYGNKCALLNPQIKSKSEQTMLKKYGVSNLFYSKEFQDNLHDKIMEDYGCNNIAQIPYIREKIKQTNLEKYGNEWSCASSEIIKKMRKSLYNNGTVPTSKTEKIICDMIAEIYGVDNCFPSYPYDKLNLDCLLIINGQKIDIEADGWYWHKNKQEEDKRRNYFLIKKGFKILRIRFNNNLPTKEQIIEAIDYLVKDNHSLAYIDLDI